VYPNMVRDAPDRIRGSLLVASRDGDACWRTARTFL